MKREDYRPSITIAPAFQTLFDTIPQDSPSRKVNRVLELAEASLPVLRDMVRQLVQTPVEWSALRTSYAVSDGSLGSIWQTLAMGRDKSFTLSPVDARELSYRLEEAPLDVALVARWMMDEWNKFGILPWEN